LALQVLLQTLLDCSLRRLSKLTQHRQGLQFRLPRLAKLFKGGLRELAHTLSMLRADVAVCQFISDT
jgi:hypothetical protein